MTSLIYLWGINRADVKMLDMDIGLVSKYDMVICINSIYYGVWQIGDISVYAYYAAYRWSESTKIIIMSR